MPQQRSALSEISENPRKRPNLTPTQRIQIISKGEAGCSTAELAAEFGCSARTVRRTLQEAPTHHNGLETPRSGRPSILSGREERVIYRAVRAAPKIEYKELREVTTLHYPDGTTSKPPSRSTLYRMLKRRGLTNHKAKKRPKLTRAHALARLRFCREYRNFPWSRRILKFSDECSLQKGSGQNQEWVFRYKNEKWKSSIIAEESTSCKPAQMV
jgi:transposase